MAQDKQEPTGEKEPIKVSFSLPQITGGALAAATAAAIGSQLGVAGTILGAMVASIVGGVAGTLYSAGIDRTHRRVSDAIVRGYGRLRHDPSYDPDAQRVLEADGATRVLPGAAAAGSDPDAGAATPVLPDLDDTVFRPAPGATRADLQPVPAAVPRPRKPVWTVMALTVGAIFLVALSVVTVVELGLGHPLGGGSGTTVGKVVTRSSTTPTPTATATATATQTPSASTEPTASPTPTATETPSASTEPTASATPTASASTVPTGAAQPTDPAQAGG